MEIPKEMLPALAGGGGGFAFLYAISKFFAWLGKRKDRESDDQGYKMLYEKQNAETLSKLAEATVLQTGILGELKEISRELKALIQALQVENRTILQEQTELLQELLERLRDIEEDLKERRA